MTAPHFFSKTLAAHEAARECHSETGRSAVQAFTLALNIHQREGRCQPPSLATRAYYLNLRVLTADTLASRKYPRQRKD
jgi:hypothetical protein